jgi:benzoyl-CoA reductase/2-hydroxyglutaryl-CoA dehydratase subunit BcrC/BadD/HgdB
MTTINLTAFERLNEMFLLSAESLKASGKKIAGIYCNFAPTELVRAAGAVPVGLYGKKQAPIAAAETILPPDLCPLIKSSFGYAHTNTCPYFEASDFLVDETTCDGKKKMFEIMGRLKPLYLHLETDYAEHDTEQLKTRIEAFLEMVK